MTQEPEEDNGYSLKEQQELEQWEQHKRDLEELTRLRKEWDNTAARVNNFFKHLQTGTFHNPDKYKHLTTNRR